jgi:hypothetical protein
MQQCPYHQVFFPACGCATDVYTLTTPNPKSVAHGVREWRVLWVVTRGFRVRYCDGDIVWRRGWGW